MLLLPLFLYFVCLVEGLRRNAESSSEHPSKILWAALLFIHIPRRTVPRLQPASGSHRKAGGGVFSEAFSTWLPGLYSLVYLGYIWFRQVSASKKPFQSENFLPVLMVFLLAPGVLTCIHELGLLLRMGTSGVHFKIRSSGVSKFFFCNPVRMYRCWVQFDSNMLTPANSYMDNIDHARAMNKLKENLLKIIN